MIWQKQAEINNKFMEKYKIGDVLLIKDVKYKIEGVGNTHFICSNLSSKEGEDIVVKKKDFLKNITNSQKLEIN